MQSVAYVGVLYLYAMLTVIVIGLGVLLIRGVDRFVEWIRVPAAASKKKQETGWVRVVFISGVLLFFSLYTLGVLNAVGAGGEHNHDKHAAGSGSQQSGYAPPAGAPLNVVEMSRRLDEIEKQIVYYETMMARQRPWPY